VRRVLAEIVANWPFAASLAVAVAAQGLWAGRRRTALNEAMHELRRPLQALALASPEAAPPRESASVEWSVQMAAAALERLDREINGGGEAPRRSSLLAAPLLDSAVRRWQSRAALAGASLELSGETGAVAIEADRCGIGQALDNLIVNAIEHGGPRIVVEARACDGELQMCVADCGRASRPQSRPGRPAELIARFSGRRRRGHGLRLVRRTAAAHGGGFRLRRREHRTEAVLSLPLLGGGGAAG
jgi:signal transduction histidine kinase